MDWLTEEKQWERFGPAKYLPPIMGWHIGASAGERAASRDYIKKLKKKGLKHCGHCGEKISVLARFCQYCGFQQDPTYIEERIRQMAMTPDQRRVYKRITA